MSISSTLSNLSSFIQILLGAIVAISGSIVGGIISGKFMIKKMKEEEKIKIFKEVRSDILEPFMEITGDMSSSKAIDSYEGRKLLEIINENSEKLFLLPDDLRNNFRKLKDNLDNTEQGEAISRIKEMREDIWDLVEDFKLK